MHTFMSTPVCFIVAHKERFNVPQTTDKILYCLITYIFCRYFWLAVHGKTILFGKVFPV